MKEIPDQSSVFIDANIFFYQVVKHRSFWQSCEDFLERVRSGAVQGYTSVVVLNELLYKLLLGEVAQQQGIPDHQAYGYISRRPKVLEQLKVYSVLDRVEALPNLRVLEVQAQDFTRSRQLMASHSLLPSDALHLAVMERQGLQQLASNDKAYRQVPSIKLYQP